MSTKYHQPIYTSMIAALGFDVQGFAAEATGEQVEQETSMQASLTHRRSERKVCTSCKVDKPASEFRGSGTSRDGLQHFCIPCKVCAASPSYDRLMSCAQQNIWASHSPLPQRPGLLPALVTFRSIVTDYPGPGVALEKFLQLRTQGCTRRTLVARSEYAVMGDLRSLCRKDYKPALRGSIQVPFGVQHVPEW